MLRTIKSADEATLRAINEEKRLRGIDESFLLFAMGSQFDRKIVQALERLGVLCFVADPKTMTAADVVALRPKGIVLSGGPSSAYETPKFDCRIFDLGIPVLGICLGFQLWAQHVGSQVAPAAKREFGAHHLTLKDSRCELFRGCMDGSQVLQSHSDAVERCRVLEVLASTENAPVAAGRCGHLWGVQFHPEVPETKDGQRIFENFCFGICGARERFAPEPVAERKVTQLREQIGDKKVLLALSGGVDSTTVCYLIGRAVEERPGIVRAVYLKGIDRPDDEARVRRHFGTMAWLDLRIIDLTKSFLVGLRGCFSSRAKREAVRRVYKRALEKEAKVFGARFIAQGTLYTDIVESGGGLDGGTKAVIKKHHNVGLGFACEELTPLDDCFKDGARAVGRSIGVPESFRTLHPFPGPGLVVRVEGAINAKKLEIARAADGIYLEELRRTGLYDQVWQAGAVVQASRALCTKGDGAAEGWSVALWAVWSIDGFTAQWAELPTEFLRRVSQRITNEIPEVGVVVYRISDKPPATIEWE